MASKRTRKKRSSSTKPRKGVRSPKRKAPKRKPKRKAPKRKPAKRKAPKRKAKKRTTKQRSEAAKKQWRKRKTREKLIERLDLYGFRQTALPTRDELHEYMEWYSQITGQSVGTSYELFWGYKEGDDFSVDDQMNFWDE